MTIYAHTQKLAHILALEDALSAIALARDIAADEGETVDAWRILDNRRQRFIMGLSPEEDFQLEEARGDYKHWEMAREEVGRIVVSGN